MMTDPVADMLTRIRNANAIERTDALMPATKLKVAIAQVLKDEGFIQDFEIGKINKSKSGATEFVVGATLQEAKPVLRVCMKYGPDGERVIRHIQRSSRPGRRYYQGSKQLRRVLDGLGIAILSTSKGVMSDRQARKQGVGGEVLAVVW
jgi:small subunit ribosomal protein S8